MTRDLQELRLSLTSRARVSMRTSSESAHRLNSLLLGFPTGHRESAVHISIELGEFLDHLEGLRVWTSGPVAWDEDLATMVRGSVVDGQFLGELISGDVDPSSSFSRDSLMAATDRNWTGALTSFQIRDVKRLLQMRHGSNFSVPGAGKTRTALAVYSTLKAQGIVDSLVVIAPKSAHDSWTTELAAVYAQPPNHVILDGTPHAEREVTIVNYERLPSCQTELTALLRRNRSLLVLDEAHRMKRGSDGIYGSICLSLGPLAARRVILSGTPAPNGLEDLQSLVEFVWPGKGRALVARTTRLGDAVGLKPIFTRTTKRDLGLPALSISIQRVKLPPLHRKLYDALLGRFSSSVNEHERIDDLGRIVVYLLMAATSPALLAVGSSRYEALQFRVPPLALPAGDRIRSLLAELPAHEMSPKILETIRIVRENAESNRKTLVWSTFLRNISTLQDLLSDLNPAVVTGASSDEERAQAISRFREDANCKVLISNPATLGEGISLHRECHEAVYVDRDFAAGRFLQSLDRIHRLGLLPDTETNIRVLVADSTIDDLVASRLDDKIRAMDSVLDDPSLRELIDLEENLESGAVLDSSDLTAVWSYLGRQ